MKNIFLESLNFIDIWFFSITLKMKVYIDLIKIDLYVRSLKFSLFDRN